MAFVNIDETLRVLSFGRKSIGSPRIYADYYQLKDVPFSITPDPEFLFLSETHATVIEKIHYAIQCRMGFMLLTGEVGTGKTTLCRALLDQLEGKARTVYIINPSLSGLEILAAILEDLGITCHPNASKKELTDQLNQFLLAHETDIPVVIIIDEAQTMPLSTLEDLRLLSNLETDKCKLLQMLVVGQPELLDILERPEIRQLKQRVALNCYLEYLKRDEVRGYIERRLFIVGNHGQVRFSPKAIKLIHTLSGGVPRLINKICDLALTAGYIANSAVISNRHVRAASREMIDLGHPKRIITKPGLKKFTLRHWLVIFLGLGAAMLAGFAAYPYFRQTFAAAAPEAAGNQVLKQNTTLAPDSLDSHQGIAATPEKTVQWGAYILQLGSYNTLDTTLRAVDIYAQKGIETHWNHVDLGEKGILFRVFSGRYATAEKAGKFQQANNLSHARVIRAPWAIALGPADQAVKFKPFLETNQFDSYAAGGRDGRQELYCGAYIVRERAEAMVRRIGQLTGNVVGIVDCNQSSAQTRTKTNLTDNGNLS
jgi:general secretion pathway protein A